MHDDAYIGGRSENDIKCIVHCARVARNGFINDVVE